MKDRRKRPASTHPDATMRKHLIIGGCVAVTIALFAGALRTWEQRHRPPTERFVKIYRVHGCSCAFSWGRHLEAAGFTVAQVELDELGAIRRHLHTPSKFNGCHVAQFGRYFIEGHVPAAALKSLIQDRPAARGLAVVQESVKTRKERQTENIVMIDRNGRESAFNPATARYQL